MGPSRGSLHDGALPFEVGEGEGKGVEDLERLGDEVISSSFALAAFQSRCNFWVIMGRA